MAPLPSWLSGMRMALVMTGPMLGSTWRGWLWPLTRWWASTMADNTSPLPENRGAQGR